MLDKEDLEKLLRSRGGFSTRYEEEKLYMWKVYGMLKPGSDIGLWKTYRFVSQWLGEIEKTIGDFLWFVVFEHGRMENETRVYFVLGGAKFKFQRQWLLRWQQLSRGEALAFKYKVDFFPRFVNRRAQVNDCFEVVTRREGCQPLEFTRRWLPEDNDY